MQNQRTSVLGALLSGALGGAWGGALAGLAEAVLITVTSAPGEEYWLFPFAVLWYGGLGCVLGTAAVLGLAIAQRLRGRSLNFGLAAGAAVAFAALAFVVARYHVAQRIYAEQLVTLSGQGLAVHAGLLAAVVVLGAVVWWIGRSIQSLRFGVWGSAICLPGLLGVCALAATWSVPQPLPVTRQAQKSAASHPNIILIVVDTLRADAIGAYGGGTSTTPNLDRLASEGVRFEKAYAQSTWTRPSIATILTSLYPSQHGAVHKLDPLPDDVTTLAEMLQAQGYWTAGFVSNINVAPVFNFQQGFNEYNYLAPSFYFGATDSATRLAIYKGLRVARERLFGDRIFFYHYYQDATVVSEAVTKWLIEKPPLPFFLLIHYMDPHDPYFEIPYNGHGVARVSNPSPPAAAAPELRRLYAEDVTYLDDHLGLLLQRLRAAGLFDSSVIALTADHGEEFLEHNGWWHGTTLYEEAMHVPLLVRRPTEPLAGTVEASPVRTLDIVPTLLAAAALPIPANLEGRDLFAGAPQEVPLVFAEEELEGNVLTALRSGNWKVITANSGNPRGLPPVELFDLAADPREQHNLAATEPQRLQTLLQQMGGVRSAMRTRNR